MLGGNYPLLEELEAHAAAFHPSEAALFFPSGYATLSGLISTLAACGDLILYDALVHASAHEGMLPPPAARSPFAHNQFADLIAIGESDVQRTPEKGVATASDATLPQVIMLVEIIYSMDGDLAPLADLAAACKQRGWHRLVEEAHAPDLAGPHGERMEVELGMKAQVFARLITYR